MRNILIISDDLQLSTEVALILRRAGYAHIYTAGDSTEAFQMIYRLNPKLIIADLELPCAQMANLHKTLSGPLTKITLFITPHSNVDANVFQMVKKGYSHFVVHPLSEKLLLKAVREIMDSNK